MASSRTPDHRRRLGCDAWHAAACHARRGTSRRRAQWRPGAERTLSRDSESDRIYMIYGDPCSTGLRGARARAIWASIRDHPGSRDRHLKPIARITMGPITRSTGPILNPWPLISRRLSSIWERRSRFRRFAYLIRTNTGAEIQPMVVQSLGLQQRQRLPDMLRRPRAKRTLCG